MLSIDDTQPDPLIEDYEPNPVTYPPMPWVEVLRWLLAHGFNVLIFPAEDLGGCVAPQRARSTLVLFNEKLGKCEDEGLYTIETGINGHDEEVAWVYENHVPFEDWHTVLSGCNYHLKPGAVEPDEYTWSHWAHCALGLRR